LSRLRPRLEHPDRRCHFFRKRVASKPPAYDALPAARYPKTRTAAHLKSLRRAAKAPADRARCSGSHPVQFCAELLRDHRCPSLRSDSRQLSASLAGDPEFRGHQRYAQDTRVGRETLRPKDFPIPCAAKAPRFLRRRETVAPQVNVSRSSANESRTSARRAMLEREGRGQFSNSNNGKLHRVEMN